MPRVFSAGKLFLFDIQQMDKGVAIGGERFDIQFKEKAGITKAATQANAASNTSTLKTNPLLKAYQMGQQLNIQLRDSKAYLVTVTNNYGQVAATVKMTDQVNIPVSNYQKGIYFIKLTNIQDKTAYGTTVMIQ
jgi:Secretion system C-terminal sorting domain